VSTGALTAPFAFAGPEWDGALRAVYTEVSLRDIAIQRSMLAAITHDGMADTLPLFRTISRHLDERLLAAIAEGYEHGRLLLVGTTNLDARRQVIWNIGAIAATRPGAARLRTKRWASPPRRHARVRRGAARRGPPRGAR
jgi:hypothetical protein